MKGLGAGVTALLLVLLLSGFGAAADDVKTYVDRGKANLEAGHFDQALQDFDRAVKFKPNDAALYDLRGVAARAKGQDAQAMADFNQAIKLDPKYAAAYRNRSMIYYDRSAFDQSFADLKKAQDLGYHVDPDYFSLVRRKVEEKK